MIARGTNLQNHNWLVEEIEGFLQVIEIKDKKLNFKNFDELPNYTERLDKNFTHILNWNIYLEDFPGESTFSKQNQEELA